MGNSRVEMFTPVLSTPQVGILGMGRIVQKPGLNKKGKIQVRSYLTLSLTCDHRAVDGQPAGAFLSELAEVLEHPYRLLLT